MGIGLEIYNMHSINAWDVDIKEAYIQAPTSEKYYIICGIEFGAENNGNFLMIRHAFNVGKYADQVFCCILEAAWSFYVSFCARPIMIFGLEKQSIVIVHHIGNVFYCM